MLTNLPMQAIGSIDSSSEFIQTNIIGTYVLLEEARDY
jgi:dTDP-D-glucose 4,6-dehydratase